MKRDLYGNQTTDYEALVNKISGSYVTAQTKAVNL